MGSSIKYIGKIFRKTYISNPRTCAYHGVRNVSFFEKFYVYTYWKPYMVEWKPYMVESNNAAVNTHHPERLLLKNDLDLVTKTKEKVSSFFYYYYQFIYLWHKNFIVHIYKYD